MDAAAAHPRLTIRGVRTVAVEVPMRFALGTSAATIRAAPLLLIDLETEEGVTGRAYLFCYRPQRRARDRRRCSKMRSRSSRASAVAPVDIAATPRSAASR